jgi:hypothetical protein
MTINEIGGNFEPVRSFVKTTRLKLPVITYNSLK